MSLAKAHSERPKLSRNWKLFLALAVFAGFLLRLLFVDDMEYKEDEEYNFTQSVRDGWPWVGMPSGVYVPNPGMSVWAFRALALVTRSTTPTQLAHAVQLFALLGICLLLPFALRILSPREDHRPWLWAMALALVNPFAVFYQRKLWPEPLLPVFSVLMLAGWWRRERWLGAFIWGLIGAWLGQIHMSGFFFAAGFPLVTILFRSTQVSRARVRWGAWFLGSCLGALPLIPWAQYALEHPVHEAISRGWGEVLQFKFWVFWATNPLGLHLGNPLGILRGPTGWDQISDFVRYPLIAGQATYLCGLAHAVAAIAAAAILLPGFKRWIKRLGPRALVRLHAPRPEVSLALIAGIWGFGLLLTASSVMIRRYYLMVSFPLEFIWLARLALGSYDPIRAQRLLATLWVSQLFISACFVGYIHVNEGAPQGDYGDAYHVVKSKKR
jgi:hypothetical protein